MRQKGEPMVEALDIRVRGIVQGVGFRPFVYRQAKRYLVNGWVLNDRDGVFIHAEAESQLLDEFIMELSDHAPAAAKVSEIEMKEVPLQDCSSFEIRESQDEDTDDVTRISADLGLCDDCRREMFDPADRRYRYPFINCTNCGPRFTIIEDLPYDRANTSMAAFTMCDRCRSEYEDPADRRFHAQPDACFDCGPQLTWVAVRDGEAQDKVAVATDRTSSDGLLRQAVAVLQAGGVLAVKGLGGFHLVCDAENPDAIALLRRRKRRPSKPLAVMVADAQAARAWCEVGCAEEALLASPARPIVLLRKGKDAHLAPGLADGLDELGVMLPSTPLQALLLSDLTAACGSRMLVMTSGNCSGRPIVTDDARAVVELGPLVDGILGNDRPILSRFDDSVLRVLDLGGQDALQFIRRARGYAPVAVPLGFGDGEAEGDGGDGSAAAGASVRRPQVFAAGSEQKNTFAFARDGEAFVSQYIGALHDADVFDAWLEAKDRMQRLFQLAPRVLACDLHPEYAASKWARAEAFRTGLPLTEVQHHHAHIASVLGEHGLFGPCCGIAFDGTGYGPDGTLWGGEVLIANQVDYERFANLAYMPLPGGEAAIRHPLRIAYGLLWTCDLLDHPAAQGVLEALGDQAELCRSLIEGGLNTPYSSSMGRLFDGVAALLGVCTEPSYEGEAAILLDGCRAAADLSEGDAERAAERYGFDFQKNAATAQSTAHDTSVLLVDAAPVLRAVLDDLQAAVPVPVISLRFHRAVVQAVVSLAELVRSAYGIGIAALSGGCFMNRFLVEQAADALGARGFTVALNGSLPPNDGCVSYGQAVVASVSR